MDSPGEGGRTQGPRTGLPWRAVPQGRPSPQLAKDSPSLPGEKPPQPSSRSEELRSPAGLQPQSYKHLPRGARLRHGKRFGMTRSLPLSGHPRSHRECRVRPVLFRRLPGRALKPCPERGLAKLLLPLGSPPFRALGSHCSRAEGTVSPEPRAAPRKGGFSCDEVKAFGSRRDAGTSSRWKRSGMLQLNGPSHGHVVSLPRRGGRLDQEAEGPVKRQHAGRKGKLSERDILETTTTARISRESGQESRPFCRGPLGTQAARIPQKETLAKDPTRRRQMLKTRFLCRS